MSAVCVKAFGVSFSQLKAVSNLFLLPAALNKRILGSSSSYTQDLWQLLLRKAGVSTATAWPSTMVADMFSRAATPEGQSICWSCTASMSSVLGRPHRPEQKAQSVVLEGESRYLQMRCDAAEALAGLATLWPQGMPAERLAYSGEETHLCLIS